MKAVQIIKDSDVQKLVINDIPEPQVSEGKVLVEVVAAGVNPFDYKIRDGKVPNVPTPFTLGGDFAGKVKEVGEGVEGISVGDQVFGQANAFNGSSGSYLEVALTDQSFVTQKPNNLDFTQAAALPLAATSAYQALVDHAGLQSSQKVLIHGGAGGIGSFAVQIARHIGATVVTTVSGEEDQEFAKSFGAEKTINYKEENFQDVEKDFDIVFDTVGGEVAEKSFEVLKKGGTLVSMVGMPNEDLARQYEVKAIGQSSRVTKERLEAVKKMVEDGALKVHVEKTFPLEKADEALNYLRDVHPKGKVVLVVKE